MTDTIAPLGLASDLADAGPGQALILNGRVPSPLGPWLCGVDARADRPVGRAVREASWRRSDRRLTTATCGSTDIFRWDVCLQAPMLQLEAYLGGRSREEPSRDALLVTEHANGVLLAVADGVTPTTRTPRREDMCGSMHAAWSVLDELACADVDADLEEVLKAANARLDRECSRATMPVLDDRDRPQAAAVAAMIGLDRAGVPNALDIVHAADCAAWVRRGRRWSLVTTTPKLRSDTQAAVDEWLRCNPRAPLAERLAMERRTITTSDCWHVTALGRYDTPKLRRHRLSGPVDAVVVLSDGVAMHHFGDSPPLEPQEWLHGGTHRGESAADRDDVAMLHLRVGD